MFFQSNNILAYWWRRLYTAATCSEKYSSLFILISIRNGFWYGLRFSVAGMSRCVHNLSLGGNKHCDLCLFTCAGTMVISKSHKYSRDCKQQHPCPKIVCNLVTRRNNSRVYLQKEQIALLTRSLCTGLSER